METVLIILTVLGVLYLYDWIEQRSHPKVPTRPIEDNAGVTVIRSNKDRRPSNERSGSSIDSCGPITAQSIPARVHRDNRKATCEDVMEVLNELEETIQTSRKVSREQLLILIDQAKDLLSDIEEKKEEKRSAEDRMPDPEWWENLRGP